MSRQGRHRPLWDPGAQPERTYQSWTRTALAFVACTLLATRLAPSAGLAAVGLSVVGGVTAVLVVRAQRHRLRASVIGPQPGPVLAMTALTVALAAAALVLVVA